MRLPTYVKTGGKIRPRLAAGLDHPGQFTARVLLVFSIVTWSASSSAAISGRGLVWQIPVTRWLWPVGLAVKNPDFSVASRGHWVSTDCVGHGTSRRRWLWREGIQQSYD
jgi:hypothetical protein